MSSSPGGLDTISAPQILQGNSRHGGKRALVIDDEEVVCQVVEGFLSSDGWQVESAASLDEAVTSFEARPCPVVVCDVHLPGDMSNFFRKTRACDPLVQIIMFTGDPTIDSVLEALQQGAYDYLQKPCSRANLVHVARQAFDKYTLLREQARLQNENESYRRRLEELVQRRTEQLRETELKYRTLFDCAVDAIFLVEIPSGIICDFNPVAARLLRVKGSDLMGRPISGFVQDQLAKSLSEASDKEHGEWRYESVTLASGDGQVRYARVSVGKVDLDDRTYLQVVARDTTDQLELKQRTELMELEFVSGQRLATIGLLAAGIAHNINTPLMGIYGVAQLLKMKYPALTDIDSILTQVERINDIIRNLMWKSRQEQDQTFQEIDLSQLLTEELRFLEADLEFKHNVEKVYEFSDEIPTIMGRYSDFSQSLTNIVRNSLDAMHGCEPKTLTIKTAVKDGEIQITIKDNGCGIAKEDCDKIFLPFYTTKPTVRDGNSDSPTGTGLGLSMVHKLLAPYSVRYELDSEPNKGTSFTLCIPLSLNSAAAHHKHKVT
jgi:PAS domain S-box-containing protein